MRHRFKVWIFLCYKVSLAVQKLCSVHIRLRAAGPGASCWPSQSTAEPGVGKEMGTWACLSHLQQGLRSGPWEMGGELGEGNSFTLPLGCVLESVDWE